MSLTFGVGVAHDAVSLVIAKGRRVVWHGERRADDSHGAALVHLLQQLPKRWKRRRGTRVRVAVGPANCQVKPLAGVPSNASASAVSQIVTTGTERFFLRNGVPLVTTDAERRGDVWWAAAFPQPLIDEMRVAAEKSGVSLAECVPAAGLLPLALQGERLTWKDGEVFAEVRVKAGVWTSLRRMRGCDGAEAVEGHATAGLAALDHGDRRWAVAYAAATAPAAAGMALRPRSATSVRRRASAVRALLVTAAAVAAAGALATPGLAAWYTGLSADRMLDSLQSATAQVARVNYELQRVSAEESEVARFVAGRRSFTGLLGALSMAIPDSTAVTSFHADSTGGTAVLLSPAGAQVLGALDSLSDIALPQIVGPISSQTVNGAALQRIALRFRFPGTTQPRSNRRLALEPRRSGGH